MLRTHSAGRGKLTNARVNDHIHADGLICHYCERLRRRADVAAPAVVAIQNVISWRQSDPIFSILVCCHVRDFCLLVTAQDDEWIIRIILRCHFRWLSHQLAGLLGTK